MILIFANCLLLFNAAVFAVESRPEQNAEQEKEKKKEQETETKTEQKSAADKTFDVVSARPCSQLTNFFGGRTGWTGGDAAYSVPLSKGHNLWLFGDTFIGGVSDLNGGQCRDEASIMIHNSVACQDLNQPDAPLRFYWKIKDGKAGSIFVPGQPNTFYWPGHGFCANGKLYIFLHRIVSKKNDLTAWDFAAVGDDLVCVQNPQDKPTAWRMKNKSLPPGMIWGNAVIVDGDFLYAYGSSPTAAQGPFKHPIVLARLPLDKLQEQDLSSAWQYWCEPGQWSDKADHLKVLIKDGASEMSVGRVRGLCGYFAVYTAAGIGPDILARHADCPEGPWSEPQEIYRCPEPGKGQFLYAAKGHPELATADGEMIITYCCNCESFAENFQHAEIYRPRAVRIILKQSND